MSKTQAKLELLFWERAPPLAILAAAAIAQVSVDAKPNPKFTKDSLPMLLLQSGRYTSYTNLNTALETAFWDAPVTHLC